MEQEKPWFVFINHECICMNNIDYLNHVMEKSKEAIRIHNRLAMLYAMNDLIDLKIQQPAFYRRYHSVINGELGTLERLSKDSMEKIR